MVLKETPYWAAIPGSMENLILLLPSPESVSRTDFQSCNQHILVHLSFFFLSCWKGLGEPHPPPWCPGRRDVLRTPSPLFLIAGVATFGTWCRRPAAVVASLIDYVENPFFIFIPITSYSVENVYAYGSIRIRNAVTLQQRKERSEGRGSPYRETPNPRLSLPRRSSPSHRAWSSRIPRVDSCILLSEGSAQAFHLRSPSCCGHPL